MNESKSKESNQKVSKKNKPSWQTEKYNRSVGGRYGQQKRTINAENNYVLTKNVKIVSGFVYFSIRLIMYRDFLFEELQVFLANILIFTT